MGRSGGPATRNLRRGGVNIGQMRHFGEHDTAAALDTGILRSEFAHRLQPVRAGPGPLPGPIRASVEKQFHGLAAVLIHEGPVDFAFDAQNLFRPHRRNDQSCEKIARA